MLSAFLYQQVLSGMLSRRMSSVSIQMLYSISANFSFMIETANEYSKIISANEEIQTTLRNAAERDDYRYEPKVNVAVSRLIGGSTFIESADIYDKSGNRYNAYKQAVKIPGLQHVREADWYSEVLEKRGGIVIRLNGGGLFLPPRIPKNYISVIREINSLYTQEPIGIIIVNFPADMLKRIYEGTLGSYETEVAVLDANNDFVVGTTDDLGLDVTAFLGEAGTGDSYWKVRKSDGIEYLVSYLKIPETGWKIIGVIPIRELSRDSRTFGAIAFAVIAVNCLLLLTGSLLVSRSITVPINRLIHSMKAAEKGEFELVDIKAGDNEIGQLRDGYNTMIEEIRNLISKIVEEQKTKRKTELDALQAQIKPHFLYNTFDAISSLALSGRNRDVYAIMKALGTYYRTSLSKGREVITIGEELDVVVNYLKIQKYRYEDLFSVTYDVDESAKRYRILKLVLQPFVENALYHGIKPTGKSGTIAVRIRDCGGEILMEVADDGAGMPRERLERLLAGKVLGEEPGFGVWGTIERLKIFYGIDDAVSIESADGSGTTIRIRVPALTEAADA